MKLKLTWGDCCSHTYMAQLKVNCHYDVIMTSLTGTQAQGTRDNRTRH